MKLLDECLSVEISDNEINIITLDVVRCMVLRKHPFRLCPPILLEHSSLFQRVLKDTEMMRSKMYFVPVMLLTKSVCKKEAQTSLSKSGSRILNEQQVLVARPQFFYRSG